MQSFLSALFAPEVLGLVLLAAVGLFVFLLLRPREQDSAEEFWIVYIQERLGSDKSTASMNGKPEMTRAESR